MTDKLVIAKSSYPHLVELLADDLQETCNDLSIHMPPLAMQDQSLSVPDNELIDSCPHPSFIADGSTGNLSTFDVHTASPVQAVNDGTEAEQAIGSLLANLNDPEFDESFINAVLDLISTQDVGTAQQDKQPLGKI